MVEQKYHDRPHDRHDHAPDVEAGDADSPYQGEQKSSDDPSDDPEENVEDDTLSLLVDDLACNETGNQAQNDPADDGHTFLPGDDPISRGTWRPRLPLVRPWLPPLSTGLAVPRICLTSPVDRRVH